MEYWIKIGLTTTMLVVISGQNGTAPELKEGCRKPIIGGVKCPGNKKKCPLNDTCDDPLECPCMDGYKSHNRTVGIRIFIDCDDINECNNRSHKCGAYSRCNNTAGAYFCICVNGFRKGNVTEFCPTDNKTENACSDIDECTENPNLCGPNQICKNKVGSYECVCKSGFLNISNQCKDIDECTENPNLCGPNQICNNKVGSYDCVCKSGFLNISNQCKVTECNGNRRICGLKGICNASKGNLSCSCQDKYKPVSLGFPYPQCNVQCKNENRTTCNDPGHGCLLRKFIELYKPSCKDNGSGKLNMSELLDDLENLISNVSISDKIQRLNISGQLLKGVEGVIQNLAYLFHDLMPVYNKNNFINAKMVNITSQDKILLRNKNSFLQMAAKTALGDAYTSVVGCLEYGNVNKLSKLLEGAELLNDTQNLTVKLVSPVVSVFLGTRNTTNLSEPIELHLNITKEATPEKALCAFWSVKDRAWSTEGCETLERSQNGVVCRCNHLTSFAVLMALDNIESWALDLITKIGLSISIVCLALAILTFCFCRFLRGTRNTIHIHLCVCLLLGHIIFLTGIDSASNKALCGIVAGLLHFFYLSSFCWMSLEGLELYLMLVTVFKTQVKTRYLLAVGYGVPTVIIAISAAVKPDGYGTKKYCWLSLDGSFIWSFMGPVCVIILVNCGIFVLTVWKLAEKMTTINPEQGKLKRIRTLTVTSIAQLCILGCCWAFGFLMFGKSSLFFAYAFTICNVLQGVQIFFLHCLMNKKVRETYANAICAIAHFRSPLYSEFSNSTNMHTQSKAKTSKESGL